MPSSFLDLQNITKHFGGVTALSDVDFNIRPGEVHCLVGENGSGKSTLIKIMAGVEEPDSGGTICIDGQLVSGMTPAESILRGIQVIYQDLSLFPNLSVAENIAIEHHRGLHLTCGSQIFDIARTAMDRIGVSLDPHVLLETLPIAKRQLVAICRAVANDARFVIMDEPTASLTRKEVASLLALTRGLRDRGVSVMFVSHRLDEVLEVADRVTILVNGKKNGTYEAEGMTAERLGELMTGQLFKYAPIEEQIDDAPIMLAIDKLSRAGEYAGISFEVRKGEILGITGRLGSGRTELAHSIFGMTKPDSGRIMLNGKQIRFGSNRAAIEAGIAYVPEDRISLGLVTEHPIMSNIASTTLPKLTERLGLVNDRTKRSMAERWIKDLGMQVSDVAHPVRTLSGGNQQRVVLAKWLETRPSLLILDSPTVGVDIAAKASLFEIVRKLAADGLAVIMISDEVQEVYYHAHRVKVMRNGRFVSEHRPSQSTEHQIAEAVDA